MTRPAHPPALTPAPACPFCDGPTDRPVLWHSDVKVFEPLGPVVLGHVLVVPKEHVQDARTDPDVTAKVFRIAAMVAQEIGPCNLITSAGTEATQTVLHLHVHVVPRRHGDGLKLPWTDQP